MPTTSQFFAKAAQQTPSADNSQPWKLTWKGNKLFVSYDNLRVGNKTFAADSHAILLTIGALSENLTQAASALGIKLDWTWFDDLIGPEPIYFQLNIEQPGNQPVALDYSLPLFKRHTNRLPYQNNPLHSNTISWLKNETVDSARVLVFEDSSTIHKIAKLVHSSSEIRFQTQQVHEWLSNSLRFDTQIADQFGEGLDVATIDLPPGGRLFLRLISDWRRMHFLNQFGAYKAMAKLESQPIEKAPLIVAIVGPSKFRDTIAAGQLMNKAWIALNAQDLAVHPFYVVADQLQRRKAKAIPSHLIKQVDDVFEQSNLLFQLKEDEDLHMLFRVGYPKNTPIKSKRLPLSAVASGIEY